MIGARRRTLLSAGAAAVTLWSMAPSASAIVDLPGQRRRLRLHVLSDTHISDVYPMTMRDMRVALWDLIRSAPQPDALVITGDLTEYGRAQDYRLFEVALATSPHPDRVLLCIGNHEYHAVEDPAVMRDRFLEHIGRSTVYYYKEVRGYPLVFLGSEGIVPGEESPHTSTALITDAQLAWLEDTLSRVARVDRPTLVFLHQPPEDTDRTAALRQLLAGVPNLFLFFGHWHRDLRAATTVPDRRLLGNEEGYWRIHTSATTYVNEVVRQSSDRFGLVFRPDWSQGVVVDVYDTAVVIRGRDCVTGKWLSEFQAVIPIGE